MDLTSLDKILTFCSSVIILFGFFGNFISFLVFSSKKFQNTIFSTYFRLLCVFDSLFFIFTVLHQHLPKYFSFDLYAQSIYLCKILSYLQFGSNSFSVWTIVIISIDRMFSIVWPNQFQIRKKSKFQIIILFAMISCILVYWLPVFFLIDIQYEQNGSNQTVELKCKEKNNLVFWFELANNTMIPFIFMILSTIMTLSKLFRSRRHSNQSSTAKRKDKKFAITSILLNFMFLIISLPLTLTSLFLNYFDNQLNRLILDVLTVLFGLNYADIFYVNLMVNSLFRKEFFNMMNHFKIKIENFFYKNT
jgi:hypothetical protein